jgi:hypothetical protein
MLEGYYSIKKISDIENITFTLLKSLPLVKFWWEIYWERYNEDELVTLNIGPCWKL